MAHSIKAKIKEFKEANEKYDFWNIGNQVLYDMCKKYPYHKDKAEIIAKVWLIGRSYAASIERNKNNRNISDDFYSDKVAPQFKKNHTFDGDVSGLKKLKEGNIGIVLETHKKVVDFIREITGGDHRAFVSKYLHFHFPNLFFIYDSRVAGIIHSVFCRIGRSQQDVNRLLPELKKCDKIYARFFIKCFYFWEFCEKEKLPLNLRQIDSFLIGEANKKVRKNNRGQL